MFRGIIINPIALGYFIKMSDSIKVILIFYTNEGLRLVNSAENVIFNRNPYPGRFYFSNDSRMDVFIKL